MRKHANRADLIAAMTEDLRPVRRIKFGHGLLLIGLATLLASAVSIVTHQFWNGILSGEASGYFWITNGLLLVIGITSAAGLVAGAKPHVGSKASAPAWSAAMLAIVPVAALITIISGNEGSTFAGLNDPAAWYCTSASLAAGALVAFSALLWLRNGAPVSLERSGWLTGLAAGSLGTLAYGITCPLDNLGHLGLWHMVPVAISAVIGRLIVPPLIRW